MLVADSTVDEKEMKGSGTGDGAALLLASAFCEIARGFPGRVRALLTGTGPRQERLHMAAMHILLGYTEQKLDEEMGPGGGDEIIKDLIGIMVRKACPGLFPGHDYTPALSEYFVTFFASNYALYSDFIAACANDDPCLKASEWLGRLLGSTHVAEQLSRKLYQGWKGQEEVIRRLIGAAKGCL